MDCCKDKLKSPKTGNNACCALRAVIIDDSEMIMKFVSTDLNHHGIDVVGFALCGEDGIRVALELRPDIVLMDINMPGMGGIKATKALHALAPEVTIVGLSSCERNELSVRKMLCAGAAAYVQKDRLLDDLSDVIHRITSVRQTKSA